VKRFKLAPVLAGLALCSAVSARAAIETYDIDPVHSWLGFTVSHFFTQVPGYFGGVNGTFVVDRDRPENSRVYAVIEAASITTNARKRDDDLRSTNFLAAATFPTICFKSTAWKSAGGIATYAVTGDLTIKGVKKEVVLRVASRGFGLGLKDASISGWEVSAVLDRRDFDIAAGQGVIGNTVEVLIFIEADLRAPTQIAVPAVKANALLQREVAK
jgi:polyisoprenoid-binding protein YceI